MAPMSSTVVSESGLRGPAALGSSSRVLPPSPPPGCGAWPEALESDLPPDHRRERLVMLPNHLSAEDGGGGGNTHTHAHTYTYIHTHTHSHTYTHTRTHAHRHAHTHTHTHTQTHTHIFNVFACGLYKGVNACMVVGVGVWVCVCVWGVCGSVGGRGLCHFLLWSFLSFHFFVLIIHFPFFTRD